MVGGRVNLKHLAGSQQSVANLNRYHGSRKRDHDQARDILNPILLKASSGSNLTLDALA